VYSCTPQTHPCAPQMRPRTLHMCPRTSNAFMHISNVSMCKLSNVSMHTLNASMHIPKTRIITATLLHYHCRVHLIAACKLSIPMCLHNVCLPAGLLLSVRQNVCQGAAQDRYSQRVCLLPVSLPHAWDWALFAGIGNSRNLLGSTECFDMLLPSVKLEF